MNTRRPDVDGICFTLDTGSACLGRALTLVLGPSGLGMITGCCTISFPTRGAHCIAVGGAAACISTDPCAAAARPGPRAGPIGREAGKRAGTDNCAADGPCAAAGAYVDTGTAAAAGRCPTAGTCATAGTRIAAGTCIAAGRFVAAGFGAAADAGAATGAGASAGTCAGAGTCAAAGAGAGATAARLWFLVPACCPTISCVLPLCMAASAGLQASAVSGKRGKRKSNGPPAPVQESPAYHY